MPMSSSRLSSGVRWSWRVASGKQKSRIPRSSRKLSVRWALLLLAVVVAVVLVLVVAAVAVVAVRWVEVAADVEMDLDLDLDLLDLWLGLLVRLALLPVLLLLAAVVTLEVRLAFVVVERGGWDFMDGLIRDVDVRDGTGMEDCREKVIVSSKVGKKGKQERNKSCLWIAFYIELISLVLYTQSINDVNE